MPRHTAARAIRSTTYGRGHYRTDSRAVRAAVKRQSVPVDLDSLAREIGAQSAA